jgi:hypothetical protein
MHRGLIAWLLFFDVLDLLGKLPSRDLRYNTVDDLELPLWWQRYEFVHQAAAATLLRGTTTALRKCKRSRHWLGHEEIEVARWVTQVRELNLRPHSFFVMLV